MFDRLSRSWTLVKASAGVLVQDKELLLFPLVSSLAALLVMAGFAIPAIGMGALDGLASHGEQTLNAAAYALAFLFYICQYFVIFYFNSALVGSAMIRLDGGDPTVSDGLRIANSRIGNILAYAVVAATFGMILRAIQERVGFLGKFVVGLIGMGWTLATYLVVPVLVSRDVGPVDAIKESATLLKKTWGENVIGQAGMGFAFVLIYLGMGLGGAALVFLAVLTGNTSIMIAAGIIAVSAILITALVQAALSGIYSAALYRFATKHEGTQGFDSATLKQAFLPAK